MCMLQRLFALFFCWIVLFSCRNDDRASQRGVSAAEALSTIRIPDGFEVELIAAEPIVFDPVDMEIDEFGRMYVVEMPGYPLDKSHSGKVILLSDTDDDGTMDTRTVYRDNLMLPTGIQRWKNGVIITDSPHILYLEDSDNDGWAEIIDTLITGFGLTNPQHNMNSPTYGLDNWIYAAHENVIKTRDYVDEFGDEGTEVYYPADPGGARLPKNANGRSVRFRPDSRELEMMANQCQFGQTFDKWGRWFGCSHSNHIFQEKIANRYFERNMSLPSAEAVASLSDHLNAAEVFPTTTQPDRQLLTNVGVMTSASGITAYLGGIFPPPFDGDIVFVAEPVSNLVHVDRLKDTATGYIASRILHNEEFFTSTDFWSRPVNMYVGPDGALYVLDYYRRVIESPEWMSKEAIEAGDLYDGLDKGRIYRVTPKGHGKADWTKGLSLGNATGKELVDKLADPNAWWRMNAQRLLVDRADTTLISDLVEMATTHEYEMARLHALWTLSGMGRLDPHLIRHALNDTVPGIRENAIRLAEAALPSTPTLSEALINMQHDPSPQVRLQLLLTLGDLDTRQSYQARSNILFNNIDDKWIQIAALSAIASHEGPLLSDVLKRFKNTEPAYASLIERLTGMIGATDDGPMITRLIQQSTARAGRPSLEGWEAPVLSGLAAGMQSRTGTTLVRSTDQQTLVDIFFKTSADALRTATLKLLKASGIQNPQLQRSSVKQAVALALDASVPTQKRAAATEYLTLGEVEEHLDVLKNLLTPQEQIPVQLAALRTMGTIAGTAGCEFLIAQWPTLTNEIRDAAIRLFLRDSAKVAILIGAMENGIVSTGAVSFNASVSLMLNPSEALRERARKLFTDNAQKAKEVAKSYQEALQLPGDSEKGKQVYLENCAICHQIKGKLGVSFGPDLGTIHNWKKEDVLANIIDPNLSIVAGYDFWEIETKDGDILQGVIAAESASAVTLKNSGQADLIISRNNIRSLRSLGVSSMPSGLEKNISKEAMANLLEFLKKPQ